MWIELYQLIALIEGLNTAFFWEELLFIVIMWLGRLYGSQDTIWYLLYLIVELPHVTHPILFTIVLIRYLFYDGYSLYENYKSRQDELNEWRSEYAH